MVTYIVTSEINTPFWKRILRFLRLYPKREEFYMTFSYEKFQEGAIIKASSSKNSDLKILKKNSV